MRKLLLPFSFIYWIGVTFRNWFFDIKIFRTLYVGVPVVSVGNISSGGSGKTPFVEMLIRRFSESRKVAVVSRGYKRKSSGQVVVSDGTGIRAQAEHAGDEPSQIAQKFPGIIVIADTLRVRGAQKAIDLGAEVILLDDGFQHRSLGRISNIAVATAEELLKGDLLLPAGNRREPLASLRRADLIAISSCTGKEEFERAQGVIAGFRKPVVGLQISVSALRDAATGKEIERRSVVQKKAVLFSGIGNPKSFERTVQELGVVILDYKVFPDHHWYNEHDVHAIMENPAGRRVDLFLTTEKDFMRLRGHSGMFSAINLPVLIVEIEQRILFGNEIIDSLMQRIG
jgi:tetraacyldisaccharide 4'-kinase